MRKLFGVGLVIGYLLLAPESNRVTAANLECTIVKERLFAPGAEVVRLARLQGLGAAANLGIFKAPLAVNTDGAPTSYHPDDFKGQTLAINRIDNGITITSESKKKLSVQQKIAVFDQWRKSGSWTVPPGYRISWKNVIAADDAGNPCIFKHDNAGYFGSLTALKNGLAPQDAGECQSKNQLDQLFVPAIVLRGDTNPLKEYGAKTGDLVLAINPANGVVIPAIIGDTGDGKRIGEGSVALNMALLQKADQPTTYPEALQLDTGNSDIIIAVLPGRRRYQLRRPYSAENIGVRVEAWSKENGYGSLNEMAAAVEVCAKGL